MSRRIRPVSRILKIETEIRRSGSAVCGRDAELPGLDRIWFPAVDIYEKEDEVVLEIELAGVLKKDVKILLAGNRVEVKGLKREVPDGEGARYHRLERAYGTFRRLIFLPAAVAAEGTSATLENGILTIVLKKPPRRGREVEVRIAKTDE
jgi:HSP20 family protein